MGGRPSAHPHLGIEKTVCNDHTKATSSNDGDRSSYRSPRHGILKFANLDSIEPAVLYSRTILPAAPTMQANYRQIASTSASYQPPSLTTDGLLVAAPATPELPAAQLVSTELLAVHLPTSNLPAAPHKAINLPAVTADASRQPAAPSALWLQPAVQQDCTGLLAVPHSLHRSPATLCDQSILPAAACGYTILLAARAHEYIQPADRMNTTRLPVESY